MTSTGCQTCEYMIPYCEQCTVGTQNTGYELYSAAQFLDDAFYLGCNSCAYGRYLEQKQGAQPLKCQSCSLKYDGCVSCGTDGSFCERCAPTHLLEGSYLDKPCVPCNYYMSGCIKCSDSTTCTQRAPV